MSEWALAAVGAFWFGVLTSISPCLMATNVTAISFIARRVDKPRYIILSGLCYTLGQALAFIALALFIVTSLVSIPVLAHWLQKYMFKLLGPTLILVAILLLELFDVTIGTGRLRQWAQQHSGSGGMWAAALLGVAFAMSFCPTTAALFFGSLIPLAVAHESGLFLPFMYALGVAVPVLTFAFIIALAAGQLGKVFQGITHTERYIRRATGLLFLAVGLYFTFAYTLNFI